MGHYDDAYIRHDRELEQFRTDERLAKTAKWDKRFLALADHVAQWSKDPSTQVGAVITSGRKVLGLGYNGFPKGVEDRASYLADRTQKYPRVVHAEMNALLQSNRVLVEDPMVLYITHFSCADCAGPIINFGVKRVVTPDDGSLASRWGDSQAIALDMYQCAGVIVDFI